MATLFAVPLAAVVGYLWAWAQGDSSSLRPLASQIPGSVFLRALPITFVSVGAAGVLAGWWAARKSSTLS